MSESKNSKSDRDNRAIGGQTERDGNLGVARGELNDLLDVLEAAWTGDLTQKIKAVHVLSFS